MIHHLFKTCASATARSVGSEWESTGRAFTTEVLAEGLLGTFKRRKPAMQLNKIIPAPWDLECHPVSIPGGYLSTCNLEGWAFGTEEVNPKRWKRILNTLDRVILISGLSQISPGHSQRPFLAVILQLIALSGNVDMCDVSPIDRFVRPSNNLQDEPGYLIPCG